MRRLVVLGACLGLSLSCQTTGRTVEVPGAQPPLAELVAPPSFLTPRSQRYRVAVRPFVDQTGDAAALADASADVLMTALDEERRFSLYDASAELGPVAAPKSGGARPPRSPEGEGSSRDAAAKDVYDQLAGVVDGVLESHVTAIRLDGKGNGSFEVDYRMVDPHSRMLVTSGSARMGVKAGALVRKDFAALASALGKRFVAPDRMAAHEVSVSEVSLDGGDVKLTLDGGVEKEVARGAVGFVVEQDRITRVDRYLAKFVVVSVFPEAAVGVVVQHCNAVGRCRGGESVPPVQQAQNVHVGSRVRFK